MKPINQLFQIVSDLTAARRAHAQAVEDIAFHTSELAALSFNCDDDVRTVCNYIIGAAS